VSIVKGGMSKLASFTELEVGMSDNVESTTGAYENMELYLFFTSLFD